jgi:hypothetical protein
MPTLTYHQKLALLKELEIQIERFDTTCTKIKTKLNEQKQKLTTQQQTNKQKLSYKLYTYNIYTLNNITMPDGITLTSPKIFKK